MAKIKFDKDLVKAAALGDKDSISTMFRNFIGNEEQILDVRYFGKRVLEDFKCFVCLTDKRVAIIKRGSFGQFAYQDAFVEDVNSGIILQNSYFFLYLFCIILACTLFGIVLIPVIITTFNALNKNGLILSIKEGVNMYAPATNSKIDEVNSFWKHVANVRTQRIHFLNK